jgi:putative RNA 2'-phosphotransferase
MARQYVHLSPDASTARQVGRRKAHPCAVLVVRSLDAAAAGVTFYRGNEQVWLADLVPAEFLALVADAGGRVPPAGSDVCG